MNTELEKLMDFAVADGQLTDKEKQVLVRKAIEVGIDVDEFEMILGAKLHNRKEEINKTNAPSLRSYTKETNKEGKLRKCPSCGEPTKSFTLQCASCGHEFSEVSSNSNLKDFFNQIEKAELIHRPTIIANFPVPNSKDDILEFLSHSMGNTKTMGTQERNTYIESVGWTVKYKPELAIREREIRAWQAKATATILKGKILFKEDLHLIKLLNSYEKQLNENSLTDLEKREKSAKKVFKIVGIIFLALLIFGVYKCSADSSDSVYPDQQEKVRLEKMLIDINQKIDDNKIDAAIIQATQLRWTYYPENAAYKDTDVVFWDSQRESLLKALYKMKLDKESKD